MGWTLHEHANDDTYYVAQAGVGQAGQASPRQRGHTSSLSDDSRVNPPLQHHFDDVYHFPPEVFSSRPPLLPAKDLF